MVRSPYTPLPYYPHSIYLRGDYRVEAVEVITGTAQAVDENLNVVSKSMTEDTCRV